MRRIYVASSWRNDEQPIIVRVLRDAGHEVYDFKNPAPGNYGFRWTDIDPDFRREDLTVDGYRKLLADPIAAHGFTCDFRAMRWADTCVLVLPCGRSAHLELGWMSGAGKRTIILTQDGEEPELMALLANAIVKDMRELLEAIGV